MISKTAMQALRALRTLANLPAGIALGAGALARRTGAPENYLGKLLRVLSQQALLASRKGFGGGFRLARPAARITLFDVLRHLEPVERWTDCVMGHSGAVTARAAPCTVAG